MSPRRGPGDRRFHTPGGRFFLSTLLVIVGRVLACGMGRNMWLDVAKTISVQTATPLAMLSAPILLVRWDRAKTMWGVIEAWSWPTLGTLALPHIHSSSPPLRDAFLHTSSSRLRWLGSESHCDPRARRLGFLRFQTRAPLPFLVYSSLHTEKEKLCPLSWREMSPLTSDWFSLWRMKS